MALFKKRSGDRNEIARLRSEIEAMSARLDAVNTTEARLGPADERSR